LLVGALDADVGDEVDEALHLDGLDAAADVVAAPHPNPSPRRGEGSSGSRSKERMASSMSVAMSGRAAWFWRFCQRASGGTQKTRSAVYSSRHSSRLSRCRPWLKCR